MKVCIISNLYRPYIIGGAEIAAEELAKALNIRRNEVFIITTRSFKNIFSLLPEKEELEEGSVYRFFPINLYSVYTRERKKINPLIKIFWHIIDLWNMHTFFTVFGILKRERPDIVHTHNLHGISFSALWAARLLKIPIVHMLHDCHLLCPYGNLMCPYTRFNVCEDRPLVCKIYIFFKRCIVSNLPDIVIGPSEFIIDIHKKYGFFNSAKTEKINFFIGNARERKINHSSDTFNILYVGRLIKQKGVDILISAFKDIKVESLRLNIVGDGIQRPSLEKDAKSDKRIVFHQEVLRKDIHRFYEGADFVVVPSILYESFSMVTLEAFLFGIPVIGSMLGAIPELIQDGYNGFLFEPGNIEELKEKITILIDDSKKERKLLESLGQNAYKTSKKYNKDAMISEVVRFYEQIIK